MVSFIKRIRTLDFNPWWLKPFEMKYYKHYSHMEWNMILLVIVFVVVGFVRIVYLTPWGTPISIATLAGWYVFGGFWPVIKEVSPARALMHGLYLAVGILLFVTTLFATFVMPPPPLVG